MHTLSTHWTSAKFKRVRGAKTKFIIQRKKDNYQIICNYVSVWLYVCMTVCAGDAVTRKEYDARWKQCMLTRDWPVQDDVNITDFDNEDDCYTTGCRCGGEYILSNVDVELCLQFAPCSNCSLRIRVVYDCHDWRIQSFLFSCTDFESTCCIKYARTWHV